MRMPDKTRYLNAVRHVEAAEVPIFEFDMDPAVARQVLGREIPLVHAYELPSADNVELTLRCGNDLAYLAHVWQLGRKNIFDAEGRKHYVDGTIKTRADLANITFPDLDHVQRDIEHTLARIEGTGLGLMYGPDQTAFLVTTAVGYQDYYTDLLLDPAFIHEFQDRVEEHCLRQLELALSYPIDVVRMGAVICLKSGPMMSRELIEEFEFPCLRRQIELIKSKGRVALLHTDGDITSLIPDFIGMGVDVLHPLEPCGGALDIYALKARYGDRIALHGNIDLSGVLSRGTPEEVARDVREHLDRLAGGGGYICSSSHNITADIPVDNFYAMRDTVVNYRYAG